MNIVINDKHSQVRANGLEHGDTAIFHANASNSYVVRMSQWNKQRCLVVIATLVPAHDLEAAHYAYEVGHRFFHFADMFVVPVKATLTLTI